MCPGETFDDPFMGRCAVNLCLTGEIPDLNNSVTATASEVIKTLWVFSHCIDAIDMSIPQLRDEGRSKHPIELGGIEGSCIFPSPFEWMEGRVKISRLTSHTRPWGLVGRCWASEGLDLLLGYQLLISSSLGCPSHHIVLL